MAEARGRELLGQPLAWPLARHIRAQQRFSREHLPLDTRQRRLDRFCVFSAHDFAPDRLTVWLQTRSDFKETYARAFRVKRDSELPADVMDAVQHDVIPQFNLRNIGRAERQNDPADPLPLEPLEGVGGRPGAELAEVRTAKVPRPEMAQIWSVRLMGRVRGSLRRIVTEDPWELRLGPDATSGHEGRGYTFVADGTHPHDRPDAWWGPETVRPPEKWHGPALQAGDDEHAAEMFAQMREMTR